MPPAFLREQLDFTGHAIRPHQANVSQPFRAQDSVDLFREDDVSGAAHPRMNGGRCATHRRPLEHEQLVDLVGRHTCRIWV